jgi:hypothetical protein
VPDARTESAVICPTGCPGDFVSSPFCKNILVFRKRKSVYIHRRLVPLEGRIAVVTDAGRDAVDAAASGATRDAGRALAREHATARGRTMLFAPAPEFDGPVPGSAKPLAQAGRVRRKRVVLTPRRRRQVARRFCGPNRARTTNIRAATVTRKPDHRGEPAISRKTIACGNAGRFR